MSEEQATEQDTYIDIDDFSKVWVDLSNEFYQYFFVILNILIV